MWATASLPSMVANFLSAMIARSPRSGGFEFLQLVNLPQIFKGAPGFGLVHDAESEADVHDHIVAHTCGRHVGQAGFFDNAAKVDFALTAERLTAADAENFPRNSQTHG